MAKNKYEVGDVITLDNLPKVKKDLIIDMGTQVEASKHMIDSIAAGIQSKRTQMWEFIHHEFPELDGYNLSLNHKEGTITIIGKGDKE